VVFLSTGVKKLTLLPRDLEKYHTAMNLGMPEMLFILLLALLLFGPKKLPQMSRELGKALNEFKRASNEFKNQLETEIAQVEAAEHEKRVSTPISEEIPAASATAGTVFAGDSAGEIIEPRILPPSEPVVATTVGYAVEAGPSPAKPPDADPAHDSDLAPSNLAVVRAENTGSADFNKIPLRESNA
jgi:sec-independent protein translocase protein TatB